MKRNAGRLHGSEVCLGVWHQRGMMMFHLDASYMVPSCTSIIIIIHCLVKLNIHVSVKQVRKTWSIKVELTFIIKIWRVTEYIGFCSNKNEFLHSQDFENVKICLIVITVSWSALGIKGFVLVFKMFSRWELLCNFYVSCRFCSRYNSPELSIDFEKSKGAYPFALPINPWTGSKILPLS